MEYRCFKSFIGDSLTDNIQKKLRLSFIIKMKGHSINKFLEF